MNSFVDLLMFLKNSNDCFKNFRVARASLGYFNEDARKIQLEYR